MVIVSAAVASLAAGNAFCLYRFLFARCAAHCRHEAVLTLFEAVLHESKGFAAFFAGYHAF